MVKQWLFKLKNMSWINVNDRLQEENKDVLVYTDWNSSQWQIMSYSNGDWYLSDWVTHSDYDKQNGVLFWYELPKSPIDEKDRNIIDFSW